MTLNIYRVHNDRINIAHTHKNPPTAMYIPSHYIVYIVIRVDIISLYRAPPLHLIVTYAVGHTYIIMMQHGRPNLFHDRNPIPSYPLISCKNNII